MKRSRPAWCLVTIAIATSGAMACASRASRSNAPPAGEGGPSPLYQEVQALDDRLSAAFNAHDAEGVMALFGDDLEFYHDIEGLQSFAQVAEASRGLFANDNGIRRDLVPGTLRVYPVPGFGAIELGTHRFCHEESGELDCGTFEFVHIWRRQADEWKLVRVISYGHG